MNLQHRPADSNRRLIVFLLIFLASVLLLKGISIPSTAQSTDERVLEDTIPKHLPIKVKIKKEKEKAFKDLKNEKWLRALEIEVTNTGDKPIYFLDLLVRLPEVTAPNGHNVAFSLYYGRAALGDITTKAEPDDVPIKPGETHVFSLAHKQEAWESFKDKEKWPQPKKITLKFQILSFGDGTGFWGNEGLSVPHAPNEKSSTGRCLDKSNKGDPPALKWRRTSPSHQSVTLIDRLPVESSPAIFLSTALSHPISLKAGSLPDFCCPGTDCFYSKPYLEYSCYNCGIQERLMGAFCSDPIASCRLVSYTSDLCTIPETGETYLSLKLTSFPAEGQRRRRTRLRRGQHLRQPPQRHQHHRQPRARIWIAQTRRPTSPRVPAP